MGTVWNVSDHHFGHKRVAQDRGFGDDTREHDETVVARHNKVVRKDDIVWFHGDLCLSNLDYALKMVARMKGTKHLIWGNHDAGWPGNTGSSGKMRRYLSVFESVHFCKLRKIAGQKVMMSHMPYVGDHTAVPRYPELRLPDTGLPLIHGHVHDKWKIKGMQLNVGLDVWDLTPVSLDAINAWLASL